MKLCEFSSENEEQVLYHVTLTSSVPSILKKGLIRFQPSNWTMNGDRYGEGEIYCFDHESDAKRWAAKMDWDLNKEMGSGKISIVKIKRGSQPWETDMNDPLSQFSNKGTWLKSQQFVPAVQIISTAPFTHEMARSLMAEHKIDNVVGAGAVPDNQNIDYLGLRVQMKPSIFLKLASSLLEEPSKGLEQYIGNGGAIASPFLDIDIPREWMQGIVAKPAQIEGHEGRNRMHALLKLEGDNPVEVHLFFNGLRSKNITPEMIKCLNTGMYVENSRKWLKGPLFTEKLVESANLTRKMWHVSPTKNRKSILQTGLQARNQEFANIERSPGIYLFATLDQAADWAYWFSFTEGKSTDVWEISLPRTYQLTADSHPEMDIYNSFIGFENIAPAQLRIVKTQKAVANTLDSPPASKKISNFSLDEGGGYIPINSAEAKDPRWIMAITADIKPGETQRQAKKFGNKTDKAGRPPLLRADGKI